MDGHRAIDFKDVPCLRNPPDSLLHLLQHSFSKEGVTIDKEYMETLKLMSTTWLLLHTCLMSLNSFNIFHRKKVLDILLYAWISTSCLCMTCQQTLDELLNFYASHQWDHNVPSVSSFVWHFSFSASPGTKPDYLNLASHPDKTFSQGYNPVSI